LFPELHAKLQSKTIEKARKLLLDLGLEGFENYYPSQLSGGMRQRVALARTLMGELDLLLLDEPFGALDAITRTQMQKLLLKIWKKYQKTILFVTHDVEEALILSDRIYLFTPRPARVKEVIKIDLKRPRDIGSEEFAKYKSAILNRLWENFK